LNVSQLQIVRYRVIESKAVCIVEAMDPAGGADDVRARTFEALLDRRALDRAYRIARLIVGDPIEAEDATHDAALTAWRHFADLREPARFEAWFGRILVNACRDRIRARRRLPISVEANWVGPLRDARSADPADAFVRQELLRNAIRSLSPDHREVVVLRYYADLTVEQIAERIGTRAGTVKSRLHYALRRLRADVDASGDGRIQR
jgi:RNA polymerase sigma-70 factor (ECF subfamily)